MSFENIIKPLEDMKEYAMLLDTLQSARRALVTEVYGISDTQKALIAAALSSKLDKSCLIVTHNDILARKLYEDIAFFVPERAELFPSGEMIFHKIDARSNEIRQKRLSVIKKITAGQKLIVCASIEALLSKMVSPERFLDLVRHFETGQTLDLHQMADYFIHGGYERVDMVEGRGQFSIRGGILDFYSPAEENPVRIELFDDEIDSIRYFDVMTQRSIAKINTVEIIPARETLLDKMDLSSGAQAVSEALSRRIKSLNAAKKKASAARLQENISEDIEKMAQGIHFEGIDKYSVFFNENRHGFLDYMKDCLVVVDEPGRVRQRYDNIELEFQEYFKHLLEENEVLPEQYQSFHNYDELIIRMKNHSVVSLNTLLKSSSDFRSDHIISFTARSMHPFHGKINLLLEEVETWKNKKYRVLILSGTADRGERLVQGLQDNNIQAVFKKKLDTIPQEGHILVIPGTLNNGFEFPGIKYAVVSDREVFGTQKKTSEKKKGRAIKAFTDLKVGDFVVHEHHGIGQYVGIEKLRIDGLTRDYLHIRYSGNDKLYIPTDQLDMIQKYIGAEEKGPKLNRLGSTEWAKVKARAKKAIESLAQDLLQLYAQRQQQLGYAFNKDTKWQKEFEDLFPYQETTDQIRCIEEIKQDMEGTRVMDRLLCGDVGYGKTEVALRAAFKAVMDDKQVAILAPTTILAQQHYNTCVQRFSNFPIKVEVLSRFKTPSEQGKVIEQLKIGGVDIIIGTHRLLQSDVVFKDLGLLIVDEEQRFGVAHKEKIKSIKTNVDVLTLTATPIPRTLHMSMIGIRDISVIEEPPEERYPVQTYVMEYHEEVVRDAIIKEVSRGGQVYYLYNRVKSIAKVAARLKELVPEARIAYAHGQMEERVLEDVMLDFYNGEFDVLVSTTIIESGLDIPNVNTIIISDADKMGLSQLYQLRGRVGRSNRLAYAYLTYQKDKVLNEVAEKRLQAIKEFTEFGSGFKIAMRDLEIRGTGNLLGREQHGHMEAIGYDLYIKLLEEAVREMKGEPPIENIDTAIELQINAHIPEDYIQDEYQKIEIYKKIAYIENQEDLYDIEEEVEDRFGDIPTPVRNLMAIARIKNQAKKCGITNISQKVNKILVKFKSDRHVKPEAAVAIAAEYRNNILFTASEQPYFTLRIDNQKPEELLSLIWHIVEKIGSFHNE